MSVRTTWFLVLALITPLLAIACSGDDTTERERTRGSVEATLSSLEVPDTPGGITGPGSTTGAPEPEVALRLEGDPETTFSGFCTAGTEESVISGQVPKLYRFDLNGQDLSCRIQKRNPGGGNLRVVLLSGDNTRSVQQTNSTGGIIRLSYTS